MRILKRWYFGFCWNLRLVIIELWSLEGFWFSFRGFFWRLGIVSHGEIFEFPSFSFCLKMLFNLNGKAMLWHTHCFFFFAMSQFWLAHHSQKKFKMKICSLPKIQCSTLKYRFSLLSPTYNIYIYERRTTFAKALWDQKWSAMGNSLGNMSKTFWILIFF